MKKFTIEALIFFFPLIVMLLLMEFLLRQIPNDYKYKKEYLDKNSDKVEILILGNSHSFYDINPIYFTSSCFNASHVTQSLDLDLEILKKYEQNWTKLRVVVVPISYFSLFESLKTSFESWRVKNYILYYGINTSNAFKDHTELLSNNLIVNLSRLTSYYILGKPAISCSDLGWGNRYNSKNAQSLIETASEASMRHTIKDNKSFNENVTALKSIIGFGHRHNIKIVLFTPVAYETYVTNLNKEQITKTIETAETVSNQSDNCYYFNFLQNKSFSASDFYDADHLNEIGAEKFTLLLDKLIRDKVELNRIEKPGDH
jgi:hypothetical protein